MIVVSNTTPLIGLAQIGRFELLQQLFGEIYIPPAVYSEAVIAGREEGGAKQEVSAAQWIKTVAVQDHLAVEVLLKRIQVVGSSTTMSSATIRRRIAQFIRHPRFQTTEKGVESLSTPLSDSTPFHFSLPKAIIFSSSLRFFRY